MKDNAVGQDEEEVDMNVFLVLRASDLAKRDDSSFKKTYAGVTIDSRYAGKFGWFWVKALKRLGCTVYAYPFITGRMDDKISFVHRAVSEVKKINPIKFLLEKKLENDLISQSGTYKPDFILVDAGWSIPPYTIKKIGQGNNMPIFNWLYDDPVAQNWENVLESLRYYTCIFVWDPYYVEEFKKHGAQRVVYLPCACDSDVHRYFPVNPNYQSDIAFVGTITPPRLDILERVSQFGLGIWTWNPRALPDSLKKYYRGFAWGERVSEIYCSSKIVLNLHHPQTVLGVNMKTFEIASCGAFQLVDFRKEMQSLFEIGKELICYNNTEELVKLVEYYLAHPEERKNIAQQAQKRVRDEHTYEHRMKKIMQYL